MTSKLFVFLRSHEGEKENREDRRIGEGKYRRVWYGYALDEAVEAAE
jgi:hypothetical protein